MGPRNRADQNGCARRGPNDAIQVFQHRSIRPKDHPAHTPRQGLILRNIKDDMPTLRIARRQSGKADQNHKRRQ